MNPLAPFHRARVMALAPPPNPINRKQRPCSCAPWTCRARASSSLCKGQACRKAGQRACYLEIATRCDSTTSRVGSLTPAFSSRPSWGWFITTRRPYERATKPLQPDRRAVDSHPLSGWHARGTRQQRPAAASEGDRRNRKRSEEHTSELQSLMRISYAV